MNHNDVARQTAPQLPARALTSYTLTPRVLGLNGAERVGEEPWLRPLARPLPARRLFRLCEGGR